MVVVAKMMMKTNVEAQWRDTIVKSYHTHTHTPGSLRTNERSTHTQTPKVCRGRGTIKKVKKNERSVCLLTKPAQRILCPVVPCAGLVVVTEIETFSVVRQYFSSSFFGCRNTNRRRVSYRVSSSLSLLLSSQSTNRRDVRSENAHSLLLFRL